MGPGALRDMLANLRLPTSPNLLIGLDVSDDAAVYKIDDHTAMVQTVDFFPPIVDDPYTFGAIAAANALSDIYAMGGKPVLALAVAAFPDVLDPQIAAAILQGGADKVAEAGAVVAGGHTVVDREPKYGLCVTGLIDPVRLTPKANARPGDQLLLTKPIGTGIITTAAKQDRVQAGDLAVTIDSMLQLNRRAADLARQVTIHSATDITGFGLLGHAAEIARNSGVGLRIETAQLPILPGALGYAEAGCIPGGLDRNMLYLEADNYVHYARELPEPLRLILFDPQTSGGLLFALPPEAASELTRLCADADQAIWTIGEVVAGSGIEIRA
jgi:selenide,water dikinase